MAWTIEFDDKAKKEMASLDKQAAKRITMFMRQRIAKLNSPRDIGEALRGARLGELWKYRIGDYRVIARIEDKVLRVLVVKVGNRREVYR